MEGLLIIEENFGNEVRFHYDDETRQSYVHGSDFAKVLLFKNPSQAVTTHVWMEYRFKIAVGVGAPAWWLSKAGAYQLLFASDHPKAVDIQRWVFEEVLPKVEAEGGYIRPDATQQQKEALISKLTADLELAEKKAELYSAIQGVTLKAFYGILKQALGSKLKAKPEHFCNVTADYLGNMKLGSWGDPWRADLGGNKQSEDYYYPANSMLSASRLYLVNFQPKAVRAFDEHFGETEEVVFEPRVAAAKSIFPPLV